MNGMEISKRYYYDVAEPALKHDFPDLYHRLAAGLVGNGSECFGFDDEISRDHDWGSDFFLWVNENDRVFINELTEWKNKLFDLHPPQYQRTRSEYGARISVMTTGDFYKSLIGSPDRPANLIDWLRIPEENLAMTVNGEIFTDNAGDFTAVRAKLLQYYPEDIRKKKLAAKCMAIAQTGQYNLNRCYIRKDWVTYQTVLSRFSENVIAAVFILNRVYRPYYKWSYKKMTMLPVLGQKIGEILNSIAISYGVNERAYGSIKDDIDNICRLLVAELNRQQLSSSDDWFLTSQGEDIQKSIEDSFLRALPAQYD